MLSVRENARKWTLRQLVYITLTTLIVVCVALYIVGKSTGGSWADVWMPNFIAEWSGIFLAVVIIERLLERERRAPLRKQAGVDIQGVLETILEMARIVYRWEDRADATDAAVEAGAFMIHWADTTSSALPATPYLDMWVTTTKRAGEELREILARYSAYGALDPSEVADLNLLERSLADSSKQPQETLDGQGAADATSANQLVQASRAVAMSFSFVAKDLQRLTGKALTTER